MTPPLGWAWWAIAVSVFLFRQLKKKNLSSVISALLVNNAGGPEAR